MRHAHLDDPPPRPCRPRAAGPRGGAAQPRAGDHPAGRGEPGRDEPGDDGGGRHRHRGVRHLSGHVLLPTLAPGMLVVVDNVGAHQPDRIRQLVAAAGCRLVFLPAYSPDLTPIEEAFSKIKALVKAAAARTRAALDAAIAAALEAVIPADAAGWFAHAGYPSRQAA